MNLTWREVSSSDLDLLAEWNYQMLRDQGHRNARTVPQLRQRMEQWLRGEYRAVIFGESEPTGYALFKEEPSEIYLRHFFVRRDCRRAGIGRTAFSLLRSQVWPDGVRLTVEVLCENQRGNAFWKSVGFRDYSLTLEIRE